MRVADSVFARVFVCLAFVAGVWSFAASCDDGGRTVLLEPEEAFKSELTFQLGGAAQGLPSGAEVIEFFGDDSLHALLADELERGVEDIAASLLINPVDGEMGQYSLTGIGDTGDEAAKLADAAYREFSDQLTKRVEAQMEEEREELNQQMREQEEKVAAARARMAAALEQLEGVNVGEELDRIDREDALD